MANEAIGMIETKGLVALVQAPDAMLKAASVKFVTWNKVGSAAVDAGASAARSVGEVQSVHVIARPHDNLSTVLPKQPQPAGNAPPRHTR
jgi:microcompartment protein CcmL/EutN